MPRFSVIVPAFKVQGYLRECLDSVLSQSFTDLEVIGVDDCSPDGSGRILDEYAARDDRVRAVHLPHNVGLGRARNAGVELARGDYLLFLDSDDSYLPGALAAIARRLDRTGDPDVLVFDHVRTYWWGRSARSVFRDLLASAGTETFNVFERPEYLHLFAVAWNKAYRREFYTGQGLLFDPGLYEDAPLAYKAMVSAERVACLDHPCVAYRQRRQGAITKTPGRRHFDIFPQYAGLFTFLDARPHLEPLRPVLFERMISHFLFTVGRPERVRRTDRPAFFRTAAAFYRRYRPAGFTPPEKVSALDFRLMSYGVYWPLGLHLLTRRALGAVRKRARKARTRLGRRVYRIYYRAHLMLPVRDDLAVYSAYWNRPPTCSPAAIQRAASQLAPHVHSVWVVRRESVPALPPGTDYVLSGSRRYWRVMARARYLVNNVNFPNGVVKRPGTIHVQTHHGTPLKKMGLDQQPYPASANGMSFARLLERADRWDFSVSSNQHSTEVWERVYPCQFETIESGYPRNDAFSTATAEDVLRIRASLGIADGVTAILYAPTHRDYRRGFVPQLDMERLCRALGPDHVLLVRAHYFYQEDDRLRELQAEGLLRDVSEYPSTEDLCLAADVLLTDYSSIMFDYANLDRPIVVYGDDWRTYEQSRGVYFDLLSGAPGDTPGAVATTEEELAEVFRSGAYDGEQATALRAAFRARFCQFDDGRAAERVVRRVFLGEPPETLPPVVPLAERRIAPTPRQAALARGAAQGAAWAGSAADRGADVAAVTGPDAVAGGEAVAGGPGTGTGLLTPEKSS